MIALALAACARGARRCSRRSGSRRVAGGRDGVDRRLRAGHRLRPRRRPGRPARRHRALRPRARDDARRARARAAQPRGALLPRELTRRGCGPAGIHAPRARSTSCCGGRRGYAIVAGRDLSARPGEVVVEHGLAREWDLRPGDRLVVGAARRAARSPAIARLARQRRLSRSPRPRGSTSPSESAAARRDRAPTSRCCGCTTRAGRRHARRRRARSRSAWATCASSRARASGCCSSQAAGIVIALLVAFSLVALVAAGTMLAAGAHADVQRRLAAIGVQRALGFTPASIAGAAGARGGARGAARGRAGARPRRARGRRPGGRPARGAQRAPAGRALLGSAAARSPASWRSSSPPRRGPPGAPRGGRPRRSCAAATSPRGAPARAARGGLRRASARASRPPRAAAGSPPVATIGVSAGVVTLMLALASLLVRLRDDPGTVGKRYQLTAHSTRRAAGGARRSPAWPTRPRALRVDGADSFRLGQPLRLIAFPGDHTRFEAPPLADGPAAARRRRGRGRRSGSPTRSACARVDARRAAAHRRRAAVPRRGRRAGAGERRPGRLRAARTGCSPRAGLTPALAVRLDAGRRPRGGRRARCAALGARPSRVGGATTRDGALPRHPRRGAARRRAGGRARLPIRAGPGAGDHRARAARRGRPPARGGGADGHGRARARGRGAGRRPARGASLGACSRRRPRAGRRRLAAGYADLALAPARPGRARGRLPGRARGAARPRVTRRICASPSSPGCGEE